MIKVTRIDTGKPQSSALAPYKRHSKQVMRVKSRLDMPTDFSIANSLRRSCTLVVMVLNTLAIAIREISTIKL